MDHGQQAEKLFYRGCNCAQSVFVAFCDLTGLPEEQAMRLASAFGGGLGRMRELCGALSGACLVLGWLYGYAVPGDDRVKGEQYARVQAVAKAFRKDCGALRCGDLLDNPDNSPTPSPRTQSYYHSRPCAGFVRRAAELVDAYIRENPIPPAAE